MIKKIILLINNIFLIRDFKKKNKKIFNNTNKKGNKKILLEFNSNNLSIIANSFFVNYLKKKQNIQIISYLFVFNFYYFNKIKLKVLEFFDYKYFGIYKSFGVNEFIINKESKNFSKKVDFNLKSIFSKIKSKKDILKIRINKIIIGDLLYDSYLRAYNKPTIDLSDQQFINFTKSFLKLFFYWEDYISKNKKNITSIIVSHCVYYAGIPLRLCIKNNIDSFQVNVHGIHKLNKKKLFSYTEFKDYPKKFKVLDDKNKNAYLNKAKNRIKLRLSGKVAVDISYSKKSAYGNFLKKRLIKKSPNIKVLIAAHCFSDSPHSFGENLFVDFYEWIHFLGNISNKTKYDWYIKTHPDFIQSTKDTIINFTKKYPKLKLLPSNASHNQIISEGINFVLTSYGTIGHEYAALNKIVINASLNNPHIAYKFNLHPKNIKQYEKMLLNLKNVKLKIDKKEIYEFYYMKYLYRGDNWLLDYKLLEKKIKYKLFSTTTIYKYWLEQLDEKKIDKVNRNIKNFINSKDYNLSPKHIN